MVMWHVQQQVMPFRNIWASLTGGLRLDGLGCESRIRKKIFIIAKTVHSSSDARPAFCTMGTGVLPRGVKRLECEIDFTSRSSTEVMNEWSCILLLSVTLQDVCSDKLMRFTEVRCSSFSSF